MKKNFKKIIFGLMAMCFSFSLAGCDQGNTITPVTTSDSLYVHKV